MTPLDPDDPILTVISLSEIVGRLVGVIEGLHARVDRLELEAIYRRETPAPASIPPRR